MEITLEKTIADKLDLRRVTNPNKKTLRKFNLRYEVQTIEGEPQRFVIYFKMDVYNTAAFKLKIEYAAIFKTSEDINMDFLTSHFTKINAPAIAYPYLRSYVSFICLNSGLEPAILPTINFIEFSKENFSEENN